MKIINDCDEDLVLQVDGGASRVLLRPYARVCLRVDTSHLVRVLTGSPQSEAPGEASHQCRFYWMHQDTHKSVFRHQCMRHQGHMHEHLDVYGSTPTPAELNEAKGAGVKDC